MVKRLNTFLTLGAIAIIAVGYFAFFSPVKANPSFFIRSGTTATTTPAGFLSPGAGTTTITAFDLGVGGAQGADSAVLTLQFTGSTTPTTATVATTTYRVTIEYSQNNIDWYSDSSVSTTTTLGWEATNGVVNASTTPTKIPIVLTTPTKWIRAVVSIPSGSTNGSVWGEFIAKRQSN